MWQELKDLRHAVDEWLDEIELLTSDDPLPQEVEDMTEELLNAPVVYMFAVLEEGGKV